MLIHTASQVSTDAHRTIQDPYRAYSKLATSCPVRSCHPSSSYYVAQKLPET